MPETVRSQGEPEPKAEILRAEKEIYPPPPSILSEAYIKDYEALYERSMDDVEAFWAEQAQELEWFEPWKEVLSNASAPFYKWFVGAKTNIVHNALDRHINTWRRNKLALIWEGEKGDHKTYSYYRLWQEVNKFANVLKSMGVKRGDTVTIYLGRIPELMIAMLATAKLRCLEKTPGKRFKAVEDIVSLFEGQVSPTA